MNQFANGSGTGIVVLGSTGSIGTQTLDIIRRNPDIYRVVALSAHQNAELLIEQAREFLPDIIIVTDSEAAGKVSDALGDQCDVRAGEDAVTEICSVPEVAVVVAAIVGFAGLRAVVAALTANKTVALANKESLVAGGELIRELLDTGTGKIFPIDSEHNSIYQLLRGYHSAELNKIILTASGGPFLRTAISELGQVTPAQAVAHPRWKMGAKISVDSATLMNKGLELIEARWLFDVPAEKLGVLVHPQSLVHGLVELRNGTLLAALSTNDMRLPISVALGAAQQFTTDPTSVCHLKHGVNLLDLSSQERLEFYEVDNERFPALSLCYEVMRKGGAYPAVLNAANEVAVQSFLQGGCTYPGIVEIVAETVGSYAGRTIRTLDDIISADDWGRTFANKLLA